MGETHFVFAPDLPASMAWYNALLGHAPEPDTRRTRYRLPHGEIVLTRMGRSGQHRLLLDSPEEVWEYLASASARHLELAHLAGYGRGHDPAGNTILLVPAARRG